MLNHQLISYCFYFSLLSIDLTEDDLAHDVGGSRSRVSRSRQKSTDSGSHQIPRHNSISDDESEDQKYGRSQSRIDKWKAKHEAMLKLAEDKATTTANPAATTENGSGSSNAGSSSKEEGSENGKETGPEIPNIEEGVCIDFDQQQSQRKNISKPHTRHNTAVQQQALSV